MTRTPIYVGRRFSHLLVVERVPTISGRKSRWRCECSCGESYVASGSQLLQGHARSCGCRVFNPRRTTHGYSGTPEFWIWWQMKRRCSEPSHTYWHRYGGRGITVCKRWQDDCGAFVRDMGPRPPGGTLERKNNNRGYSPGNCVWATRHEQMQNVSTNHRLRVDGETLSLSEAARRKGFKLGTLRYRVRAGWPLARLFDPLVPRHGRSRTPRFTKPA